MTRLSLLLLATIPSSIVSLNAEKWVMDDPIFDVQNKSFTFTYGSIHNEIAVPDDANYSFYGFECNGTNYYGDGKFEVTDFSKNGTNLELSFETKPDLITQDESLYAPGNASSGGGGEIAFCVRVGLYSDDIEINFLESQVTIAITLSGDFSLDTVSVVPKDKSATESEQAYQVTAALCDDGDGGPFNQGDVISVCITPAGEAADDGVVMSSVDSFIWSRDFISQTAVTGNAVIDALSTLDTADDASFKVSSILFASFYETTGSVSASGSATMKFPERRLEEEKVGDARRRRRRLQEDGVIPPSPFEINAEVVPMDDGPSLVLSTAGSASKSLHMASTVVGIVVVAILFA